MYLIYHSFELFNLILFEIQSEHEYQKNYWQHQYLQVKNTQSISGVSLCTIIFVLPTVDFNLPGIVMWHQSLKAI